MARTLNFAHARTKFQRDVMRRIARDKVCPFCMKHFLKYHTKPVLRQGKHWVLTENFQPYEGSRHHLLAVSKKHTTRFDTLSPAAQAELFSLMGAELKKRKVAGGALFMRFGDTDYTGGSVEHLHAQLVSGAKRGKNREPLTIYLGYKAGKKG